MYILELVIAVSIDDQNIFLVLFFVILLAFSLEHRTPEEHQCSHVGLTDVSIKDYWSLLTKLILNNKLKLMLYPEYARPEIWRFFAICNQ